MYVICHVYSPCVSELNNLSAAKIQERFDDLIRKGYNPRSLFEMYEEGGSGVISKVVSNHSVFPSPMVVSIFAHDSLNQINFERACRAGGLPLNRYELGVLADRFSSVGSTSVVVLKPFFDFVGSRSRQLALTGLRGPNEAPLGREMIRPPAPSVLMRRPRYSGSQRVDESQLLLRDVSGWLNTTATREEVRDFEDFTRSMDLFQRSHVHEGDGVFRA